MAKIADADKNRAGKVGSAWVKAVWVGRVGKSNEHLLLTTKGCIRSRVVRRIPDGNQAGYHAEVQGLPWDTLKGSAEMLRKPGEPPRPSRGRPRKDGSPPQARTTTMSGQEATRDDPMPGSSDDHARQPTVGQDVIEQDMVVDTEASRVSDDRTDQGALRMDQEEGTTAEEQARRRLRSKQPARRSLTDAEAVSKRLKREATIAAIKTRDSQDCYREARFGTGAQNLCKHQDNEEPRVDSCVKNDGDQQVERERGVVERWSREAAMAAGGQIFNAVRVDEQHKEKSRHVVNDFANTRGRCLQQPKILQWEEWLSSKQCFRTTACSRSM